MCRCRSTIRPPVCSHLLRSNLPNRKPVVISKSRIIGAVEIGTHKVSVLVGEFAGGRRLNIIGLGSCSAQGVIKGSIVDFKAASDCTHAAIEAAERKAGA